MPKYLCLPKKTKNRRVKEDIKKGKKPRPN